MIPHSILLYCHRQLTSGQPAWTYIAPIITSVLSLIATGVAVYISYRIPTKVARMQLKHEAFEVFKNKFNLHFSLWGDKNGEHINDCLETIDNFKNNYDYLFNFPSEYFKDLEDTLNKNKEDLGDYANKLIQSKLSSSFKEAEKSWQALLAKLGKRTIE